MIVDIIALLNVILLGAETLELAEEVITALDTAITLLNPLTEPTYAELSLDDKTEMLKKCTKIVANLDLNLSCYPLGYTTTILFDLEGNPVP